MHAFKMQRSQSHICTHKLNNKHDMWQRQTKDKRHTKLSVEWYMIFEDVIQSLKKKSVFMMFVLSSSPNYKPTNYICSTKKVTK